MAWVQVTDYRRPAQGRQAAADEAHARRCCEQLEAGQVLFFPETPFPIGEADKKFLLAQRQGGSRYHKNISYRPQGNVLRGFTSDQADDVARMHAILRGYSEQATRFLAHLLAPYASRWALDFATFRPVEEQGRDLPLHKRNDLLHVDSFPSRPTNGGRILRFFTNVNPSAPRVWITTDRFPALAARFAADAGLANFAAYARSGRRRWERRWSAVKRAVGLRSPDYSPYDRFMLRFHDYLKENQAFQAECVKSRLEFPPYSSWLVFTDAVPHAALSGQYAVEQTFIVPHAAMVTPDRSPLKVLESLCGQSLVN
jgi:3-deoxy-D-manno-octulosonic acid hydroxylase-like protein